MDIPFAGELQKADFFRAVKLSMTLGKRESLIRISSSVLVGILFLVVLGTTFAKEGPILHNMLDAGTALIGLITIEFFALLPYINRNSFTQQQWGSKQSNLYLSGTVSSQGITLNLSRDRRERLWDDYIRIDETDDLVSMRAFDNNVTVLSRSLCNSESDWQTVRAWAISRLKVAK